MNEAEKNVKFIYDLQNLCGECDFLYIGNDKWYNYESDIFWDTDRVKELILERVENK